MRRFFPWTLIATLFGGASALADYVPAYRADDFVQSCGVCTHLTYTDKAYYQQWSIVRERLLDLGLRFIRDGGANPDMVSKMRDLSSNGVKTLWVMDPGAGIVPTNRFWSPSSVPRRLLTDFVKSTGTNVFDAVEVMNEIDLFWNRGWISDYSQAGYFYLANNTDPTNHLSRDSSSPLWWGNYIVDMTQSTWRALKNDPATALIPVVGPSFGGFHDRPPTGQNSLMNYVDFGCVHPYPFGGNPFSDQAPYAGVSWYIGHGQQPSCNIEEWPFALSAYQPAFGPKPMAATETGWFTGTASKAVSEAAQAKYVPRLFLEYFRRGIARCAHYEFLDEGTNPADNEQNRGLIRHDLSPKPAYTALKNLLTLLSDRGPSFSPQGLDYTITKTMPAGYSRSQYLRHMLLQKRNGEFWLVLWHEIASSSYTTADGREIPGVSRDISHPDVNVSLTFNTPIAQAVLYRSNTSTNPVSTNTPLKTISFPVNDTPTLLRLQVSRPQLSIAHLQPDRVNLTIEGLPGFRYAVERTSNFTNWQTIALYVSPTNRWTMVDQAPPSPAAYRALTR